MDEVVSKIYEMLSSDSQLTSMLGSDGYGNPAIYLEYSENVSSPYIVISLVDFSDVSYAVSSSTIQIDAVERSSEDKSSMKRIFDIRNRFVKILDRATEKIGTYTIRFFKDAERTVNEDSGRFRRFSVDFELRFFRYNDI